MKRFSTIRITDLTDHVLAAFAKATGHSKLQQIEDVLDNWAMRHKSILKDNKSIPLDTK